MRIQEAESFILLADLGIIEAPQDYDHYTALETFRRKNRQQFSFYSEAITSRDFSNPSRILRPEEKLHVRVFGQLAGSAVMFEDLMKFLESQKAVFTGAQGLTLVFDQKRDQMPKGRWNVSFENKDYSRKGANSYIWAPRISCFSDDSFGFFFFGYLSRGWKTPIAFLCFTDA